MNPQIYRCIMQAKREMCENKYTSLYVGLITSSVNLNKLQFLIMIECIWSHFGANKRFVI
jgi:hypothetical protein